MKLYFNFWPDPTLFILKIFFNFVIILIFLILLSTTIILLINEIKKIYIKKKFLKLLNKKILQFKQNLEKQIIHSDNPENIIKNFLEYIQLFMIKQNISDIKNLFNKLNIDNNIKQEIIDFITKDKPLSENSIIYIKNFLKNVNNRE